MTRNEYLTELNRALDFLDTESRQATLSFYAELLDDRIEEGMCEEEAVSAMEKATVIAERMRQEQRPTAPRDSALDSTPVPCTITYDEKDLSSLTVSVLCRSVMLEPSEDHVLTLQYAENEARPLLFTEENGHLTLTEEEPLNPSGVSIFGFSLSNVLDSLFRGSAKTDATLHIKVPCNILMDLKIKTTNGRIDARNLTGMGTISLTTSNGGIVLENLKCTDLRAQTSNGSVTLENAHIAKSVSCISSNGPIKAEQVTAHTGICLDTSNSRIRALQVRTGNELRLHSSNGSIQIESCQFDALSAHTSNSSISGTLPGSMQDYRIDSRTSNGSNTLPTFQDGEKQLSVKTSNGHIKIYFDQSSFTQA